MRKLNDMDFDIKKELGRIIKKERVRAGLTQMQLADKLGITYQQIQKYEMGKSSVSVERLFQIADALNVSISSLLPGGKTPQEPAPLIKDEEEAYGTHHEIEKIVSLLKSISNHKITLAVLAILEEIQRQR
ncbi:MAG TPA: XRE family transcriptional regulator [Nitrospirae bacterium]|nr:XRE family transcriptional regulator [Nitrospirota bacterium]